MFDLLKYQDKEACVGSDGRRYTYRELSVLSFEIKQKLSAHRLVFCLCSNTIEAVAGYVSFVDNANVTLLLDAHISTSIFDSLYEIYKPQYVWCPKKNEVSHEYKTLGIWGDYVLYDTQEAAIELPSDTSVLLTTSGSTGSPKLVRLSEDNLVANANSIIEYLRITDIERPVTSLPMYYSFGLSVINSHLLAGATLLLTDYSYIQPDFWKFAAETGFTSFSGVPYTYEILKKLRFWSMSFPTLKTLTQAGGKLSNELLEYFITNAQKKRIDFYLMYGQTEATARMSYLPPEYGLSKLGSIGKGIPGGKFSLIDDDNKPIDTVGETGELVYSGANVSLGYATCLEDLYKENENRGILKTGDLAYCDADGFYFIVGRKKRFLKLFGNRVSLDYIETFLKPILKECVCVGNDSKLVVCTTDMDYDAVEIVNMLSTRTKILRTVFSVQHVDTIPRSETGKILYNKIQIE